MRIIKTPKASCGPISSRQYQWDNKNCCFLIEHKVAEASPSSKKGIKIENSNYRLISILPAISKRFNRLIGSQKNHILYNKWSNLLVALRRGHCTQDALLRVINLGVNALMSRVLLGQY